jgi:hypothetical protein
LFRRLAQAKCRRRNRTEGQRHGHTIPACSDEIVEDEGIIDKAHEKGPLKNRPAGDDAAQRIHNSNIEGGAEESRCAHRDVGRSKYGSQEAHERRVENMIVRRSAPVEGLWTGDKSQVCVGLIDRNRLDMGADDRPEEGEHSSAEEGHLTLGQWKKPQHHTAFAR